MADLTYNQVAKIKVFGIGGAGGNAVNRMVQEGVQGVEFYVANTDVQALDVSPVANKIQLGKEGLGAGGNPDNGRKAAVESEDAIRKAILYGGEVRYGVKEGRMLTALMENAYISDRERREVKF